MDEQGMPNVVAGGIMKANVFLVARLNFPRWAVDQQTMTTRFMTAVFLILVSLTQVCQSLAGQADRPQRARQLPAEGLAQPGAADDAIGFGR